MKAFHLIERKNIISSFTDKGFFVKSYSRLNGSLHVMKVDENGLIRCDSHFPRCNVNGFCCHAIAVSLQNKCFEKYSCALQKCGEKSTTIIASKKIDTGIIGHKKVIRSRKKRIGNP